MWTGRSRPVAPFVLLYALGVAVGAVGGGTDGTVRVVGLVLVGAGCVGTAAASLLLLRGAASTPWPAWCGLLGGVLAVPLHVWALTTARDGDIGGGFFVLAVWLLLAVGATATRRRPTAPDIDGRAP